MTLGFVYSSGITVTGYRKRQTTVLGPYDAGEIVFIHLFVQISHRGTADQGLPSGALGTQNKSSHQSQHDSGTAL